MPDRITDAQLEEWERLARNIQTGPYPNGIVQEAVKFARVAAFAIPDLIADVRRLRALVAKMADNLTALVEECERDD